MATSLGEDGRSGCWGEEMAGRQSGRDKARKPANVQAGMPDKVEANRSLAQLLGRTWWQGVGAIAALIAVAVTIWAVEKPTGRSNGSPVVGTNHFVPAGNTSTVTGPAEVVEDFYAAINKHDWLSVWSLGGRYLGHGPYRTLPGMIQGYRCTVRDTVKGLTSSENTVSGYLVAHDSYRGLQSEQTYQFKYLVLRGAIRRANVKILRGRAPPGCA